MTTEQMHAAQETWNHARRILVITGAGISAEAGLPTYRGIAGLYNDNRTIEGLHIEEALSGHILETQPQITWKYLLQIEEACRNREPALAHHILASWEQTKEVVILTQNIDGLHHRAGSNNVIDIHGDLYQLLCQGCERRWTVQSYAGFALPPVCTACGGPVRPQVVFFGEMLPEPKLRQLHQELSQGFDLVLSIGTTSLFPYISGPVIQAARQGVPTMEVNPESTPVTHLVRFAFKQGAGAALAELSGEN